RNGNTALQKVQFELAEDFGAAVILMSCQRSHSHTSRHSGLQGARDLQAIEPENQDVDRLPGVLDRSNDGGDSGIGLNDELHSYLSYISKLLANRLVFLRASERPRGRRRGSDTVSDTGSDTVSDPRQRSASVPANAETPVDQARRADRGRIGLDEI